MTVRWTVRAAELTEQGYARGETKALLPAPQVRFIEKSTLRGAFFCKRTTKRRIFKVRNYFCRLVLFQEYPHISERISPTSTTIFSFLANPNNRMDCV